jgi:putative ABC transport system permease protein
MRSTVSLVAASAWNRRFALGLVVGSIALSTLLLLGMTRLRDSVRQNFSQTISGTDLIVGARTGSVQLLLYSVFRIGGATNNVSWDSIQTVAQWPGVDWVVPISLGDMHRGFPVVATSTDYFRHFHYGERQSLHLAEGRAFQDRLDATPAQAQADLFGAVIGAEVAESLGYRLGDSMVLSHGDGAIAANDHADKPFHVVGILQRTGTPVDRSVHISLAAMEALHLDWVAGAPIPGMSVPVGALAGYDLTPRQVTAALVGLKSRTAVFSVQRRIANLRQEPLMAVLPGVALDELWDVVAIGERSLLLMTSLVAVVSLGGLVAVILAGLNERRRELAILRALGASPGNIFLLLAAEGMLVTLVGVALGAVLCGGLLAAFSPWLQARFGISVALAAPRATELALMGAIVVCGWLASLVPGLRAYALSLSDGLSPKV